MKHLYWQDVKDTVKTVNNELFDILDEINPTLKIRELSYKYGDIITDKECYYQRDSDNGKLETLNSDELPLMLMTKGVIEVYLKYGDKRITFDLYEVGDFFPYTNDFEFDSKYPAKPYSIYYYHAGLKNISILPMGSINANYLDLAELYNISPKLNPDINSHQYHILKSIIKEESEWSCNLLAFDDKWKKEINTNPKWYKLKEYLLKRSLSVHKYRKSTFYADYVMRLVAKKYRTTKNQEYIFEIIKNIILTALGDTIGFAPVVNDEYLPSKLITDRFTSGYGLKFTPAIIAPKKYHYASSESPIYYSLYMNNDTINDVKSIQPSTYLEIIHKVMDYYLYEFSQHEFTKSSAFGMMKDKLSLKYYGQRGVRGEKHYMHDASQLIVDDSRFKQIYNKYNLQTNYTFPRRSNFFRALISISLES
jgi:hypothetical protein